MSIYDLIARGTDNRAAEMVHSGRMAAQQEQANRLSLQQAQMQLDEAQRKRNYRTEKSQASMIPEEGGEMPAQQFKQKELKQKYPELYAADEAEKLQAQRVAEEHYMKMDTFSRKKRGEEAKIIADVMHGVETEEEYEARRGYLDQAGINVEKMPKFNPNVLETIQLMGLGAEAVAGLNDEDKVTYTYGNVVLEGESEARAARRSTTGDVQMKDDQGNWVPFDRKGMFVSLQGGREELGLTKKVESDLQTKYNMGNSTLGVIERLKDTIRPENLGMLGSLRSGVFGAGGQIDAVGKLLLRESRSIIDKEADNERITPNTWFDPNLSKADLLANTLAYRYASYLDPSGRLSDMDVKQARKALGYDKAFANYGDFLSRIDALEGLVVDETNRAATKLDWPSVGDDQGSKYSELWGD